MNTRKNYYQLLHVQPDAPTEVIRSSYRALMQKLKMHPDLGGDPQEASLVNEAYAVLSNSAARQEYDASLKVFNRENLAETITENNRADYSDETSELTTNGICLFCKTPHSFGSSVPPDSSCNTCNSALFPAAKQALEQTDQRLIQRINRQWDITFYTHWPASRSYVGQTHDVSLNGLQLLTTIALNKHQIIKISSKPLDAVAQVVNQREEARGLLGKRWRIGVEFLTLKFHQPQGSFLEIDV